MMRPDAGAGLRGHQSIERFFQFALLGLVASGYLAVAGSGYLDAPTTLLTAAALVLRGLMIADWVRLKLSPSAATLLGVGYAGFFVADYFLLSRELLATAVHLVFFLAIIKLLSARTPRDDVFVAGISFLELITAAILSINFNFFVFLALYLTFAIATLTSAEIRRTTRRSAATARSGMKGFRPRLAVLTIWATAGILLLTAGMFFLLPRTADAAFSRLISHRIFIPGLADQVTIGEIGELKTSSRPIMHISMYLNQSTVPLKWRGGSMTEFDGKVWSDPEGVPKRLPVDNGQAVLRPLTAQPIARRMSYGVEYEELDSPALFFAGLPERVAGLPDATLKETATGCFRMLHTPPPGFRYDAYSLVEEPPETAAPPNPAPILDLATRAQDLQLPHLDPRIPQLAATMAGGATTDLARARAIETHLRSDYGYTLQLPDHTVPDPLAYFLFTRKKGHCEYFASAMAVMLRSLGIPARLATGFQSGVYNSISDLWLVRASDAHSWVEAWIPGYGWTTFDPTPADPNQSGSPTLFSKMSLYVDAAETFWQKWVVGYDPARQGTLADRVLSIHWLDALSVTAAEWDTQGKAWLKLYGLNAGIAVAAALLLWFVAPRLLKLIRLRRRVQRLRRGEAQGADATILYERMLNVLRRHGFQKPVWFTPVEFARSLAGTPFSTSVVEFTAAYNALRFGGHAEVAPHLSELLDQLEREKA
jgi:protein-glutamine gamma-glutamyltransferase